MTTIFDVVSVTCFIGLVIAFFQFSDREVRTLMYFVLGGIVFAVANYMGNVGHFYLAAVLLLAGVVFVALVLRR